MTDQYANVTVSHKMHGDRRFELLAQLGGWSRPEACWRMVELWSRCTVLQTDRPPAEEIRLCLGLRGDQHLVDAMLGERQPDGSIRVLGGGLTGGDTDRFGWYSPVRQQNREAGLKRAKTAVRGPGGKFLPSSSGQRRWSAGPADIGSPAASSAAGPAGPAASSEPPAPSSGAGEVVMSTTNTPAGPAPSSGAGFAGPARPAESSGPPASGIPEEEELSPRARAIPRSTESGTEYRTQGPTSRPTGPDRSAVLNRIRTKLDAARVRAASTRGHTVNPLLAFDRGIDSDLRGQLDLASTVEALARVEAQATHAIAMAEICVTLGHERFEWFHGAIFSPGNFTRFASMTEDEARRPRAGPRDRRPPTKRLAAPPNAPDDESFLGPLGRPSEKA